MNEGKPTNNSVLKFICTSNKHRQFRVGMKASWDHQEANSLNFVSPPSSICSFYTMIQDALLVSCSVVSDSATPWTAACQASLSFTISWSLLKLISIESMMPSNHLILCRPILLLPSIFPSIRVFSNESAHRIRWPKYPQLSKSQSISRKEKTEGTRRLPLF